MLAGVTTEELNRKVHKLSKDAHAWYDETLGGDENALGGFAGREGWEELLGSGLVNCWEDEAGRRQCRFAELDDPDDLIEITDWVCRPDPAP